MKKRIDGSAPVRVRLTNSKGESKFFNARKGDYFVKWLDVLKALRIEQEEITRNIKSLWNTEYFKANILDEDTEGWFKKLK